MSINVELADNEYFHGTPVLNALQILYEGFRWKEAASRWGRNGTFKHGIYLTKTLDVASAFAHSDIVLKCRMADGISLLRIDGDYDAKVIDSLRREFGQNLFKKDVSKAIPHNKHLTKKELIHLVNYAYGTMGQWRERKRELWSERMKSLRKQLVYHKYDAIGEPETDDGIAVFNPSYVKLVEICQVVHDENARYSIAPFDKDKFATDIKSELEDCLDYYENGKDNKQWQYMYALFERYCEENDIAIC